jgi:HAD superfamily hydrolase (TIGR01509 family)
MSCAIRSISPELLIFDCDGVLVDTETISNRLFAEAISAAGLPTSLEDSMMRYRGRTMESCMALVEERLGRSLPEGWLEVYRTRQVAEFAKGVDPIPGVTAVIETAEARGIATCVASSGSVAKMRQTLGLARLPPHFETRLFSASVVTQGKPAPDIFLYAAKRMGVKPARCLVIEDSVPGVIAARAAGMGVLGYAGDPHTDAAAHEREGAHVIHDMREAITHLTEARP